jgi:hypothetical protein
MAIYPELLSSALLADEAKEVALGELLATALTRRARVLKSGGRRGHSVERDLIHDVGYDCALIRLCSAVGIDVTASSFGRPREERARLERALAAGGLDLARLDQRQ